MTSTLLSHPLAAWFMRLRGSRPAAAAAPRRPETLEDAALRRLLPMMMGNAPHPYQASLLLYLMSQERKTPRD